MKHVFKLFTFVLDTPGWTPFTLMNIFTPSCQHQRGAGSTRESEKMGEEGPDGKCDKVLNCLNNVIRMKDDYIRFCCDCPRVQRRTSDKENFWELKDIKPRLCVVFCFSERGQRKCNMLRILRLFCDSTPMKALGNCSGVKVE